jgi:hypothetical protein
MVFWRDSKHEQVAVALTDPTSLGNILIKKGFATPEQIAQAIDRQLSIAPPLGKILMEMVVITEEQLDDALYEQKRARGETTMRADVERQLARQSQHMQSVTESLGEIAVLSNDLAQKLKVR